MSKGNVLVCYTDGSALVNPGYAGYGLYGYVLKPSKKPKSVNYPLKDKYKYTTIGILNKDSKEFKAVEKEAFECLGVVEHIGSIDNDLATNNQGEVLGVIAAIKYALLLDDISELHVISDSKYALDGYTKFLNQWRKNGYKTKNGSPIKNLDLWMEIEQLNEKLKEKSIKVKTTWVKGHEDDLGNIVADTYALVGSNYARTQLMDDVEDFQDSVFGGFTNISDFKKELVDRHIFMEYKYAMFHTATPVSKFMGFVSPYKEDLHDALGKRRLNLTYAVACGGIPVDLVSLRRSFSKLKRSFNRTAIINMDGIKRDKVIARIINKIGYEPIVVRFNNDGINEFNTFSKDGVIVTEADFKYTHLLETYAVFDLLESTIVKLDALKKHDKLIDVTDDFYDEETGKCKISSKDRTFDYTDKVLDKGFDLTNKININYGLDTPTYRLLTDIENKVKKVYIYPDISNNKNLITLITIVEYEDIYGDISYVAQTNVVNKYLTK